MISTALDKTKVLDVSQNNDNSKYTLSIWTRHGNTNQRFRFREVAGGRYQIISGLGGTVEVPNGSTADCVQIFISQPNNVENEFWQIVPASNAPGAYYIKSFCGKALDVEAAKTADGTRVLQYQFGPSNNQTWYISPASEVQQGNQQGWGQQGSQGQQGWGQQGGQQGWGGNQSLGFGSSNLFNPNQDYVISTALDKTKVLDVSQNNDNSKYTLSIWTRHGNTNQRFRFREVAGGRYQIISGLGGTVEVPNGSTADCVQIFISQPNNVENEFWQIVPASNAPGAYYIKSFCGKALDVEAAKTADGTRVLQYQHAPCGNQTWYIEKI